MEDDNFGSGEEGDCEIEGDEVKSYLPQALSSLAIAEPLAYLSQENEKVMELEKVTELT